MSSSTRLHSSRGSVLIVALVFAALIAISLGSYISLANNSLKQASRSFYASSGMNLAETGLELAAACFNQLDGPNAANAWTGWTLDPTPYDATSSPFTPAATRTFTIPGFNPGPGASAEVKVFAQHYPGITKTTTPKIVAKATITQHNGPPIHKYIEVILRKRTKFGSGISAIENISSTGGTISLRSWDSDPDNDPSTPSLPYSDARKTAAVTVASKQGNINLGGGTDVLGFASVSPGHTITAGSVHDVGTTTNDPNRLSYDFDGLFPIEEPPSYSSNPIHADVKNTSATFPRPGDFSVTIDGKEIYSYNFDEYVLQPGGTNSITVTAGKNVVFIFGFPKNINSNSISLSGGQTIAIGAGATLQVYTPHNVDLGGGGVVNTNVESASFQLYGTNPVPTQLIKIAGSSQFTGVVNAPNANVEIKGGGAGGKFVGAVVGKTVTFTGSTEFIFDEALNDHTRKNYGIAQWKELQSAAERMMYDVVPNF